MSKHLVLTVIGCWLALVAGIITAASWDTSTTQTTVVEPSKVQVNAPSPAVTKSDVAFAERRLTILSDEVHLKSERLRYEVKVRYPQITGSDEVLFKNLNQRIRRKVTDHYQWLLNPSKKDLRRFNKTFLDVYNTVDLDFEVVFENSYFLSFYFNSFAYGIGAAHAVQQSFVINYDLTSHEEKELDDFINLNPRNLKYIARYCTTYLSLQQPLAPKAKTFANWNIVREGIRFNFDACTIKACAEGAQKVIVPFTDLSY